MIYVRQVKTMNEIIRPTDELPVSVLKANHIVFDELSFVRDGFSLKDDSKTSLAMASIKYPMVNIGRP
jgi:hypothetical protein